MHSTFIAANGNMLHMNSLFTSVITLNNYLQFLGFTIVFAISIKSLFQVRWYNMHIFKYDCTVVHIKIYIPHTYKYKGIDVIAKGIKVL